MESPAITVPSSSPPASLVTASVIRRPICVVISNGIAAIAVSPIRSREIGAVCGTRPTPARSGNFAPWPGPATPSTGEQKPSETIPAPSTVSGPTGIPSASSPSSSLKVWCASSSRSPASRSPASSQAATIPSATLMPAMLAPAAALFT